MARFRTPPTCIFCGKEIAKPIYNKQSDIPVQMQLIGDNFIGWEYRKFHVCMGKINNLQNKNNTINIFKKNNI